MTILSVSKIRPGSLLPDGLALSGVIILAICAWYLVNGVAVGTYDQFAAAGEVPVAAGPVGEARANQLGHPGYFWSERAFHYRTTLMFAVDDFHDPALLSHDTFQQSPAGVDAWREYTLLMEPVYGTLYRWFGREREILVEFLLRLIPLIHVLLLPGLFLTARALGARPLAALLGTVVYAACSLGYVRLAGSLLLKEDFALLGFVWFLAAHFGAWRHRNPLLLLVACGFLLVFLAGWHLSQFLLLVVVAGTALSEILAGSGPHRPDTRQSLQMPAAYLLTAVVAGFTPSLAARGFLLGPAVMLLTAWLLTTIILLRVPRLSATAGRRLLLFGSLALLLTAAAAFNRTLTGDYSHVFGLAVQKIRHGFQLPEDPLTLPFAVRVFWAPPFTSPTWGQIQAKLGWQLLVLVPTLVWAVRAALRRVTPAPVRALALTALVFLAAWLFVERLGVIFLPLAAVAVALAAEWLAGWGRPSGGGSPSRGILLATGLVVGLAALNLGTVMRSDIRLARDVQQGKSVVVSLSDLDKALFQADVLRWLQENTPGHFSRFGGGDQPASVVADIGLSTQISLYARRPTVLNSQFENTFIRGRYQAWLEAVFSTRPADLEDFLRETRAGYVIIGRDWLTMPGPGSAGYQAGRTGDYTLDMNLARLQLAPAVLDFLQPVYNNEFYRVLRVRPAGEMPAGDFTWERNHGLWWRPDVFTREDGRLTDLAGDRRRLLTFEASLMGLQQEQAEIMAVFDSRQPLPLMQLHQQLLQTRLELAAAARAGNGGADPTGLQTRQQQLDQAIRARLRQSDSRAGRTMAQALQGLLRQGGGQRPGWLDMLTDHPAEPVHLAAAAQVAAMLGRYGQAADLLDRAVAHLDRAPVVDGLGRPGAPVPFLDRQLRQECVWWNLGAGRVDRAAELANDYGSLLPANDAAQPFYTAVSALRKP